MGIFYMQNGKLEKTKIMFEDAYMIMYEQSKEFESDYALAALNLGVTYFKIRRQEDLFEVMKHKHVFPCGGAVLHYNMALCYQDLGGIR